MQPSRGLQRLAQLQRARHIQSQCRNLSSIPRHAQQRPLSQITSAFRKPHQLAATSISSIAAIRHASTNSPTPSTTTTISPPPVTTENASFPNLDTITLDNIDLKNSALPDISGIPEGIGYLKQIGVDYGYGPTSCIQWLLEHAHIYGGLPWWGAIVVTAFTARLALFPLFLRSSDMMARQAALVSITKPITDRMTKAQKEGNTPEVMQAYQQMSAIRKRAGVSMPQQLLPIAVQGIIGYCGFKLMRACAELPVPGFVDGGFLWLRDLTLTDGYLLMPIIMAGTIHMVVRLGGETGAASATVPPGLKNVMMYGMPVVIALVTAWQPGAVCVWFASTGLIGIAQGQALQRPAIRSFFGLAPLYKPKPGEARDAGFLGAMMEDKLKDMRGDKDRGVTVTAPATPDVAGDLAGKNVAYMRPTYQSPNINRQASSRTIDTTLVTPQPSGTSAPASQVPDTGAKKPSQGIFDGVKNTFKKATQVTKAQQKEAEKKAWKKRAEQYEKDAQRRGR